MAQQQWVDYVRANKDKYPIDGIKQALIQAGASVSDAEEAVRLGLQAPAAVALPPAPAPAGDLIGTIQGVLLSPRIFFRTMPKIGGFGQPLIFLMTVILAALAFRIAVAAIFGLILNPGASAFSVFGLIGASLLTLILAPILSLIGAGIAYVLWMMLGSKENYETAFRCIAYGNAAIVLISPLEAVPYVRDAVLLGSIAYWVMLYVVMSVEIHQIGFKKAAIAFGALGSFGFFMALGSIIIGRKAASLMKAQTAGLEGMQAPLQAMAQSLAAAGAQMQVSQPQAGSAAPANAQQAMEALTKAISAPGAVKAADFSDLKALLPESLPGMKRTKSEGESNSAFGMNQSEGRASYEDSAGGTIEIKVSDVSSLGPMVKMGYSMKSESQDESGYEKTTTYGAYPAQEKYQTEAKAGELSVLVADRFVVEVNGSGVAMNAIKAAMAQVNLAKLAALK